MQTVHAIVLSVLPTWAIDLISQAYPLCLLYLITVGTLQQIATGVLF